jgi:hypothetical protein
MGFMMFVVEMEMYALIVMKMNYNSAELEHSCFTAEWMFKIFGNILSPSFVSC